ncbi:uncharacterized protein LOC144478106, partial [Augochlora pura]
METNDIKVRVNNMTSRTCIIQNGVAQGSVLNVTLFLLTINNIMKPIISPAKAFLYADDLTIICTKTEVITFNRTHLHTPTKLYLNNYLLQEVNSVKLLGIYFDSKLTGKPHISYLTKECNSILNILKTLAANNWGADQDVLINTYPAMIRSKMDYGCMIYSSATASTLKPLDTVHNPALRIATGAFRTSPIS